MEAFRTAANKALIVERSVPVAILPEQETPGGSLFLSNFDQVTAFFMSLVYSFDRNGIDMADFIKKALSKVLVHHYPVAGSLATNSQGKLTVDCDKKLGVAFVEASAKCNVKDLGDIRLLDANVSQKLVYRDPTENMLEVPPLITAQAISFGCGGLTVGISLNHCTLDGTPVVNLMNSWAEIARGKPISLVLCHERTILKSRVPPQATCTCEGFVPVSDVSNLTALFEEEQIVLKTFYFDSAKLANLKKMATADGQVMSSCSNFVLIAALVWQARSMALRMKSHQMSNTDTFSCPRTPAFNIQVPVALRMVTEMKHAVGVSTWE
ncbi:omega-hydroxypalmitate O-feruloyl transferase-like [Rhodamnia argentea]|uniref:Omega-hydroxypalmitate O-feruloyl transferase-like n=1 Tax=Rhodamnia argentea TaxID=178133 RepID=A0A8B8N689_9MYRT|nr:omega-hydroxypalmitate O-feruloyl transferase-like [Rhodamnia argentea]